jgi:hypothetical protein
MENPMTLSDYTDGKRFPVTSRPALSAKQQLQIDAFNYDQLKEYRESGSQLDDEQKAIWAELSEKMQHHARLTGVMRKAEKAAGG